MVKQQSFNMRRKKSTSRAPKLMYVDVHSNSPEKQQEADTQKQKEIVYKDPKVKIGSGKLGPVDLIIYKDDLYALKRIPKTAIDKPKRIQHIKQEKNVLLMLKQL